MKKKYVWLTLAFVYCIAIYITTASPASTGGNTLSIIADIFNLSEEQARTVNVLFRKLVHLSAFGGLAVLFFNSFEKRRFFLAWICTTVYAATDELHQAFLPNRTGSVVDVGIDSIGALIALFIIKMAASIKRR